MNKQLLILLLACGFLPVMGRAQSKCDSIFTIKVYDSASHKPLKEVQIALFFSKNHSQFSYTNRRGFAKYRLKDEDKLDLRNREYQIKVFPGLGYDYKEHIPLSLDCRCVQRVYLRKWTKEEAKRIIRAISVEDER